MLLPSVLRILDEGELQPPEPAEVGTDLSDTAASSSAERAAILGKTETEMAEAAGVSGASNQEPQPPPPITEGQRLEGLLRALTDVEKPLRSHLLDLFE